MTRPLPGDSGTFLRSFDLEHQRVFALPYVSVVGRDLKMLASPLRVYGLARLTLMCERFFDCQRDAIAPKEASVFGLAFSEKYAKDENWIGKARADVPGFLRQIPNLVKRYDFSEVK